MHKLLAAPCQKDTGHFPAKMGRTADDNWADKYKASDHHTDRLVRTKVSYEDTTGVEYPEPKPSNSNTKMAWGKGGSSNVVQVTTRSRRAYSVPAVDVGYEPIIGKKTAQTVNYHKEDADTISNASRRQDQRLLNDITTRLANAQFSQPVAPKRESRSRTRRRVPSAPSSRRASISSTYSLPTKPKSLADEDFEIIFPDELKPGPLPPCARRAQNRSVFQRSASLPPATSPVMASSKGFRSAYDFIDTTSPLYRLVDEPLKPAYASLHSRAAEKSREPPASPWAPQPAPVVPPRRRFSFAFEDPEQVEYFHVYPPRARAINGYVSVPRPYVRRYSPIPRHPYTYRAQSDYQPAPTITRGFRAASEPRPLYTPTSNLAVKQARACLGRIERELGMGSVSVGDDAPYMDEPVITTTNIVPVKAARTGFVRSTVPRTSNYNYGVVTSRPPPIPKTNSRRQEIEARLETMIVPEPISTPTSYSALRSRTSEARNKLDQHKVLLDRYLPVPSGVPNEVPYEVEYKFSELADRPSKIEAFGKTNKQISSAIFIGDQDKRMPQLRPRERKDISRAASLPPYRPVSAQNKGSGVNEYNDALRTRPFVPKVSDTRKRAREVLCRTKRDPHYFDY